MISEILSLCYKTEWDMPGHAREDFRICVIEFVL